MGLLDRILGREPEPEPVGRASSGDTAGSWAGSSPGSPARRSPDERAVERYRYLLRTAPPEAVEQAHAEAFAQLTPEQRRQVLQGLGEGVPPGERQVAGQGDDPASLARLATRTEMRRPGTLERTFGGGSPGGGYGAGPGFGSMVGGSLLGTIAGVVVGSAIANALFGPAFGDLGSDGFAGDEGGGEAGDAGDGGDATADGGDVGGETAADGGDYGGDYGADAGGGFGGDAGGGFGGDVGGGFGGGDFGGDF
jgi:hypothetical protein